MPYTCGPELTLSVTCISGNLTKGNTSNKISWRLFERCTQVKLTAQFQDPQAEYIWEASSMVALGYFCHGPVLINPGQISPDGDDDGTGSTICSMWLSSADPSAGKRPFWSVVVSWISPGRGPSFSSRNPRWYCSGCRNHHQESSQQELGAPPWIGSQQFLQVPGGFISGKRLSSTFSAMHYWIIQKVACLTIAISKIL